MEMHRQDCQDDKRQENNKQQQSDTVHRHNQPRIPAQHITQNKERHTAIQSGIYSNPMGQALQWDSNDRYTHHRHKTNFHGCRR
jgi:hypothetical protein